MSTLYTAEQIRGASLDAAKTMVKANLVASDKWLVRGLMAIYAKQTEDEKRSESTKYDNEVGFNGLDATILSSYAKQVQRWQSGQNRQYDSPLSVKQMKVARRKMLKYAGQLVSLARAAKPAASVADSIPATDAAL